MGGSGGSQTTTVDPEFNKGLLEIYKTNQKYADTFMNVFQYGVDYNPNEKVIGKTIDGKWYSQEELKAKGIEGSSGYITENPEWTKWKNDNATALSRPGYALANPEALTSPEPQRYIENANALETKTLGEIKGYDPKAQTSEMQYLQNVVQSNQQLLGLQTSTSKKELELALATATANKSLIPYQTEAAKQQAKLSSTQDKLKTGLSKTLFADINKGIDVEGRMNEAQADVQHGFQLAGEAMRKDISSYGLDPSAGRYASQNRATEMAQATGIAGARTLAKNTAEEEDFSRKLRGLQVT